jgi:hypothetical protein
MVKVKKHQIWYEEMSDMLFEVVEVSSDGLVSMYCLSGHYGMRISPISYLDAIFNDSFTYIGEL